MFYLLLFFVGITFHTQNQHPACYSLLQSINTTTPQVHHEITCSYNYIGDEGEEAEQGENWGGVCCKGKVWIDGG